MQKREVRPMTQPAKNRQARVWSMNTDRREGFLSGLKIEERVQAFWESRAGTSLRQGIPVLALCLFGGQGKLTGGAMPFAPRCLYHYTATLFFKNHIFDFITLSP